MNDAPKPEPKPSATIVVLRDADPALEVLLLQRSPKRGKPGPWVFPGGKIDPADREGSDEIEHHARRAGVREAHEEAGLRITETDLVPISRWITPPISPRRFDTWFFLTAVERDVPIRVDGVEICDHRWLGARAALDAEEVSLAPPTIVTLHWLLEHGRVRDALERLSREPVLTFRPRICRLAEGAVMLYPGDAGYETGEPDARGARHRLWAEAGGYRYERS